MSNYFNITFKFSVNDVSQHLRTPAVAIRHFCRQSCCRDQFKRWLKMTFNQANEVIRMKLDRTTYFSFVIVNFEQQRWKQTEMWKCKQFERLHWRLQICPMCQHFQAMVQKRIGGRSTMVCKCMMWFVEDNL